MASESNDSNHEEANQKINALEEKIREQDEKIRFLGDELEKIKLSTSPLEVASQSTGDDENTDSDPEDIQIEEPHRNANANLSISSSSPAKKEWTDDNDIVSTTIHTKSDRENQNNSAHIYDLSVSSLYPTKEEWTDDNNIFSDATTNAKIEKEDQNKSAHVYDLSSSIRRNTLKKRLNKKRNSNYESNKIVSAFGSTKDLTSNRDHHIISHGEFVVLHREEMDSLLDDKLKIMEEAVECRLQAKFEYSSVHIHTSAEDDNYEVSAGTGLAPDITSSAASSSSSDSSFLFRNISHISRKRSGGEHSSQDFSLDPDTYSLMMISSPCSLSWALGLATFIVFQLGLGILIVVDLSRQNSEACQFELDQTTNIVEKYCIPFNVPIRVPLEITIAQFITIILVLATQSDLVSSVHILIALRRRAEHVPWDEVIDKKGDRSVVTWLMRILFPNVIKISQSIVVLYASFIVIIQSSDIIDLLKDFTALFVISETDNILFNLADAGYMGEHIAMECAQVKNTSQLDVTVKEQDETDGYILRCLVFLCMCGVMIGGWSYIVRGQYSGSYMRLKYYNCNATNPALIGNGKCQMDFSYNSIECYWDGGDCIVNGLPECHADPNEIGNGSCNMNLPYYSQECAWDGGDCIVKGLPGCYADPREISNGRCNLNLPYISEDCNRDGGDCIVKGLPDCFVPYPDEIGNGSCNINEPYSTESCNLDGGDCFVEGYPECLVLYPTLIGDGDCHNYFQYNSTECGNDGGDCKAVEGLANCFVPNPALIANGECDDRWPFDYNTLECQWDGGDCPTPIEVDGYPGCFVDDPTKISDGQCDGSPMYNTPECKFEGGDCQAVGGFPNCYIDKSLDPSKVGDGKCDGDPMYNTPIGCNNEGGDCQAIENAPNCYIDKSLDPSKVGDGKCDGNPNYNSLIGCKYEGGDCQPVDGFPTCFLDKSLDPTKVGDGKCDLTQDTDGSYNGKYNSPGCERDGGDCVVRGYPDCFVPNPGWIKDEYCDREAPYNTLECGFDGGAC